MKMAQARKGCIMSFKGPVLKDDPYGPIAWTASIAIIALEKILLGATLHELDKEERGALEQLYKDVVFMNNARQQSEEGRLSSNDRERALSRCVFFFEKEDMDCFNHQEGNLHYIVHGSVVELKMPEDRMELQMAQRLALQIAQMADYLRSYLR